MNKWKKNLMAASVLLVVCAGIYVNWMYSSAQNVADLTDKLDAETVLSENGVIMDTTVENMNSNVTSDYFAAVRLSRQEARDSAVTKPKPATPVKSTGCGLSERAFCDTSVTKPRFSTKNCPQR